MAEVIPSMRSSMEAAELVGLLPQSWSKFFIIFSLYNSQLHLLRVFEVQIGWSLMFVRMCSSSGQWYVFSPCMASWTSVLMMPLEIGEWPTQDLVLNGGLLSGYGRLVGCGGSVGADRNPKSSLVSLLVAPGWVVGIEVHHNNCVFVMG